MAAIPVVGQPPLFAKVSSTSECARGAKTQSGIKTYQKADISHDSGAHIIASAVWNHCEVRRAIYVPRRSRRYEV